VVAAVRGGGTLQIAAGVVLICGCARSTISRCVEYGIAIAARLTRPLVAALTEASACTVAVHEYGMACAVSNDRALKGAGGVRTFVAVCTEAAI
jgi:hypothetical protein